MLKIKESLYRKAFLKEVIMNDFFMDIFSDTIPMKEDEMKQISEQRSDTSYHEFVPKAVEEELNNEFSVISKFRSKTPVYNGEVILRKWVDSDLGRWIKFSLSDEPENKINPCKGMSCGKSNGQRLKLVVTEAYNQEKEDSELVFIGEVFLLQWGDSSTDGMTLKFAMDDGPDGGDCHPFRSLRTGKDGERLHVVFWGIDDMEQLQDISEIKRKVSFDAMPAVRQAGILCSQQQFRRWLAENILILIPDVEMRQGLPAYNEGLPSKEYTEAAVRMFCGVASRSELDAKTERGFAARAKWQELMSFYHNTLGWTLIPD